LFFHDAESSVCVADKVNLFYLEVFKYYFIDIRNLFVVNHADAEVIDANKHASTTVAVAKDTGGLPNDAVTFANASVSVANDADCLANASVSVAPAAKGFLMVRLRSPTKSTESVFHRTSQVSDYSYQSVLLTVLPLPNLGLKRGLPLKPERRRENSNAPLPLV